MVDLQTFEKNTKEFNIEELKRIKLVIINEIKRREQKAKTIYTHECFGSSSYHFCKNRHYAKVLIEIDDSKVDGYAFIGDFISCQKENLIDDGAFVVEVCEDKLSLYKAQDDSKELLLTGTRKKMATFIRECKEIIEQKDNLLI